MSAPPRTLDAFVGGLAAIPAAEFRIERVAAYLAEAPVAPETLGPYLRFEPTHYTRNLVYRSDLFELMAICWEVGQSSSIHNHQGQNCWMAVPVGRLVVQNYDVVQLDARAGSCELRPADRALMDPLHPAHVDPERPVHAVLNPAELGGRAVSLHVYSLPYDRCLVYSLEGRSYREVPLFFDTEYGKPASPR